MTKLHYQNERKTTTSTNNIQIVKNNNNNNNNKKAIVTNISSLEELKMFLEDDITRPVAIYFYAPWCKTCQRLGLGYKRLAKDLGDGIVAKQKLLGTVRFAQVEYSTKTNHLISDQLRIEGVPTLQLYHGLNKVWQGSGAGRIEKDLRVQVDSMLKMDSDELIAQAQAADDGILQAAIEESFYDYSFLDEEW